MAHAGQTVGMGLRYPLPLLNSSLNFSFERHLKASSFMCVFTLACLVTHCKSPAYFFLYVSMNNVTKGFWGWEGFIFYKELSRNPRIF